LEPALADLSIGQFLANLDALTGLYAAAMTPPAQQLPGRRAIMERHTGHTAFRAVAATLPPDSETPDGGPALIGFAYGFHGETGQWWHDLVRDALAERQGHRAARGWMKDSFEVAEVHVHPAHQGRGTGHAMLLRLVAGRPELTAMLSTMDADTSAHRLYRGLGFADLLPGFLFPGASLPYTIMGAPLPLPATATRLSAAAAVPATRPATPARPAPPVSVHGRRGRRPQRGRRGPAAGRSRASRASR
jgi:GNAT superfamily N-acetyltransferase